jgi:hypothetical protein
MMPRVEFWDCRNWKSSPRRRDSAIPKGSTEESGIMKSIPPIDAKKREVGIRDDSHQFEEVYAGV